MGENTKIEWAHHTFNPWYGCQKVGPGCDHCYAEGWAKRSGLVKWGPGMERRRSSPHNWRKPLAWDAAARSLGIRQRVFCASLADVFDNAVPSDWRRELFELIGKTTNLDWLLVTKRIGNARAMLDQTIEDLAHGINNWTDYPWPNVWIGASIVNQEEADRDIPRLLAVPARVRFLSMEPLLGSVRIFDDGDPHPIQMQRGIVYPPGGLSWVIVGGESGPHARLMHPDWVRSLRDQCAGAGIPFLLKQWGAAVELGCGLPGHPRFQAGYRPGEKNGGRLLDGAIHDGYPEVRHG